MNIERLTRLITVLENVQRDNLNFEMACYGCAVSNDGEPCGSAACALGYAALDPVFIESGLHLELGENGPTPKNLDDFNQIMMKKPRAVVEPRFIDSLGFNAGSRFFGIEYSQSLYLFSPVLYLDKFSHEITPADVIARVRELINSEDAS